MRDGQTLSMSGCAKLVVQRVAIFMQVQLVELLVVVIRALC